jgi:hypothetical protein
VCSEDGMDVCGFCWLGVGCYDSSLFVSCLMIESFLVWWGGGDGVLSESLPLIHQKYIISGFKLSIQYIILSWF